MYNERLNPAKEPVGSLTQKRFISDPGTDANAEH